MVPCCADAGAGPPPPAAAPATGRPPAAAGAGASRSRSPRGDPPQPAAPAPADAAARRPRRPLPPSADGADPADTALRPVAGATALAPAGPAARGAAVAQPPSAPPRRPAKPLAERLDPLRCPTNMSNGVLTWFGGAFSFMCSVRMDGFDHWSRVFDFSLEADDDSITAGAIGLTEDMHFTVFRGKQPISVRVNKFFEPGLEFTMLCTVSASGHMKVLKNGVLVGENPRGMTPLPSPRPHMIVGGHYKFRSQSFRGSLRDVKIWDQDMS